MGLYESTDFDGTESPSWGVCPECGAEVQGETPYPKELMLRNHV
jgi:hypothetical protein